MESLVLQEGIDPSAELMTALAALFGAGQLDDAVTLGGRMAHAFPKSGLVWLALGSALQATLRGAEALVALQKAAVLWPDNAEVHNNLGNALYALGRQDEAARHYVRAVNTAPGYAEGYSNLGSALRDLGKLDDAVAQCRRALTVGPDFAAALHNLGNAEQDLGHLDAAAASYRRGLTVTPDDTETSFNLAAALLLSGHYREAWPKFECRTRALPPSAATAHQRWSGQDLTGRTILLWAEHGIGDIIQFCRFVPQIAARARVVLELPESLLKLLSPLGAQVTLVGRGRPLPPFDYHFPLMSLPLALGTTVETVPPPFGNLLMDPQRVAAWRSRLPNTGLRVGVVWQGNPAYKRDHQRSIPLTKFAPLARVPEVHLISLQTQYGLDQLDALPPDMLVQTLGGGFDAGPDAFLDSVAVMASLDLIVAIDSAIGHVAATLGFPVWLALPKVPYWTWMIRGDSSPWYPSARLFRQERWGEWDPVMDSMAAALSQAATATAAMT